MTEFETRDRYGDIALVSAVPPESTSEGKGIVYLTVMEEAGSGTNIADLSFKPKQARSLATQLLIGADIAEGGTASHPS